MRQVLEVPPEAVQERHGTIDRDALLDVDPRAAAERAARVGSGPRGIEPEHLVGLTVTAQAAANKKAAECRQDKAAAAAAAQSIQRQPRAGRHRSPPFRFTDVLPVAHT